MKGCSARDKGGQSEGESKVELVVRARGEEWPRDKRFDAKCRDVGRKWNHLLEGRGCGYAWFHIVVKWKKR